MARRRRRDGSILGVLVGEDWWREARMEGGCALERGKERVDLS